VTPEKKPKPNPASHVILMRQPETTSGANDTDPPLSAAGRARAQAAAEEMYGAGHHPGPLLASNTRAGREAAAIIAAAVHLPPEDIYFSDNLHGATTDILEVEMRPLAEEFTLLTLVAHEPGISELVRILSRDPKAAPLAPGQWRYLPWPPPY
jgi:phosphohistidine phosphatase SixA